MNQLWLGSCISAPAVASTHIDAAEVVYERPNSEKSFCGQKIVIGKAVMGIVGTINEKGH